MAPRTTGRPETARPEADRQVPETRGLQTRAREAGTQGPAGHWAGSAAPARMGRRPRPGPGSARRRSIIRRSRSPRSIPRPPAAPRATTGCSVPQRAHRPAHPHPAHPSRAHSHRTHPRWAHPHPAHRHAVPPHQAHPHRTRPPEAHSREAHSLRTLLRPLHRRTLPRRRAHSRPGHQYRARPHQGHPHQPHPHRPHPHPAHPHPGELLLPPQRPLPPSPRRLRVARGAPAVTARREAPRAVPLRRPEPIRTGPSQAGSATLPPRRCGRSGPRTGSMRRPAPPGRTVSRPGNRPRSHPANCHGWTRPVLVKAG